MPPGATSEIEVPAELGEGITICVVPKLTTELAVNPLPLIVTVSPPFALPEAGLMLVITGT